MSATAKYQTRWMIRRDMPEVLTIERRSFAHFWTEEDFLACLHQRNCIGMVAEHEERIVGFMVYELLKSQLHVLNFAVCPTMRRKQVGAEMVGRLVNKLRQQQRTAIRVEVREANIAAQLFFRSQGFAATGILRGHYEDSSEDAYCMRFTNDKTKSVYGGRNRISGWMGDE